MNSYLAIVFFLISTPFLLGENFNRQEFLVNQFKDLTYTRGWGLALQRIQDFEKNSEIEASASLQRSMAAYAFNYWALSRKELLEKNEQFDAVIIRSFREEKFLLDQLNDPLNRIHKKGFSMPAFIDELTDDEYLKLVMQFKKFITENGSAP